MDFQLYKKMLREWAKSQQPVFIMGPERSGTSLLFQQVSNHPAFCDFTHATVETFCFVKPWLLLEPAGPENYEMRVYLGQKNLQAFQESIAPLIQRNAMLTENGMAVPYLNQPNRQEIWFERRYKHVNRAFFYSSWKHLGEKRLVEKTPAHIRCAREILDTFPNAKLLICTRDPGEIVASHKKRFKREVALGKSPTDPSIAWLSHSTEQYMAYFENIDKTINGLLSDVPQSVRVVPYGELTSSPTQTLNGVYDFIGVEHINPQDMSKPRTEQAWDPLLNKAPQRNDVDLTEDLTHAEIDFIKSKKDSFSPFWK
ncbi:sulfotransferase [Alteromonas sp. 14N.309.X.WAT.G.H12]|uniref:sulfotransferase family protein n=1 Tax=Alteromonas sp. 14N.309.X.WAT.G.H12 TaxID=3120824 RepID=UPI002FD340BA